jgi:predicted dehydrogenase
LLSPTAEAVHAQAEKTGLNVLIVGCGNIAGGFDSTRDPRLPPLSHAGAYRGHGGFRLLACVEPDSERRLSFMKRWAVSSGFASLGELQSTFEPGSFDVVSLCSPTSAHAEQLRATLALRPRLVFCEKPVTPSLAETAELVQLFEEASVPLAVNHTRRWAPDVQRLAQELKAGAWGAVRSAVGTYNKGVLNNGSHLVDLLHLLLGPLTLDQAGVPVADFWPDDPTVPALLRTLEGIPVHLATAHAHDAAVFELQLTTERAVITMEDGGLSWRVRRVIDSPVFAGYRVLDGGEWQPGEYQHSTSLAVSNLHDHLKHDQPLASDGHSALAAQRLCDAIRRAATARHTTFPDLWTLPHQAQT